MAYERLWEGETEEGLISSEGVVFTRDDESIDETLVREELTLA